MSTSLTIDIPEVALFNREELKQMLTAFVKAMAVTAKSKREDAVKEKTEIKKLKLNWREMEISPEVMDMTFQNRVDLGTNDYKDMLQQALTK